MTRSATAILPAAHHLNELQPDASTHHPLARAIGGLALGAVLVGILFVFVEPLTLPWIITAYVGAATILGITFVANR